MLSRGSKVACERVALAAGSLCLIAGVSAAAIVAKAGAVYSTGLVLVLLGVLLIGGGVITREFRSVTAPADDAYALGFQVGLDRGFAEGHRSARPVVVPLPPAPSTCLECEDRRARESARIERRNTAYERVVNGIRPAVTEREVASDDPPA